MLADEYRNKNLYLHEEVLTDRHVTNVLECGS